MKLSFILNQARNGELAGLSKVDKTDEKIVGYINLALIALYNRFQLATEEAIVTLRPDLIKTVYTLSSVDTDVKVAGQAMRVDDFMSIVCAYNENGSQISVNDDNDPFSIYTVAYNQVQIPLLEERSYVSIVYRRNPKLVTFVDVGQGNAQEAEVELPLQLLEPMLHYIGYRAHGSVDGSIQAETNTHYTRFVAACNQAEAMGIITADDVVNNSIYSKGFV